MMFIKIIIIIEHASIKLHVFSGHNWPINQRASGPPPLFSNVTEH